MLQYGFLCLTISYSLLNAQTEIPAQVITLLDKKSYVEYKFIQWNYAGLYCRKVFVNRKYRFDLIFTSLVNFNLKFYRFFFLD